MLRKSIATVLIACGPILVLYASSQIATIRWFEPGTDSVIEQVGKTLVLKGWPEVMTLGLGVVCLIIGICLVVRRSKG